jgi:hypothetical protein
MLLLKPDWPESEVDNGDDRDDRSGNEATIADEIGDEIGDEIDLPYSEAIACGVDPSYKAWMRGFHYSKCSLYTVKVCPRDVLRLSLIFLLIIGRDPAVKVLICSLQ